MRLTVLGAATALLLPLGVQAAELPSPAEVAAFATRTLAASCQADAPGVAVLVARADEVLFRDACGKASLELDVPLSPEHVFRIGSVTKQFAAAAVLKLAEDGRLSLDDPLARFLPDYPGGDAITVRMLLDHTSGIRSYTDMPAVMPDGIMKDLDTAGLVAVFKDEPPDFAPGQGWHYNNSGYVLVGAVIEAASGQPWHAYLQETFFQPLGMTRTGYGNQAEAVIPGHVTGYTLERGRWARARHLSMSQPHAAGALVSTLDDLLRWNRALHEGRVLREDSYRAMITPAGAAAGEHYGFGIWANTLRGRPQLEHGGGIFGFTSALAYLPDERVTVAVLHNGDAHQPGVPGPAHLARALAAQAIGRPYPPKTPIPVDEARLQDYAGVYRIDADSARVVRVVDGHLASQRTGGQPYRLVPVGEDEFVFEEGFSRIVFERDGDGAVAAMRYFPEDEGDGERVARSDEPLPAAREEATLARDALDRVTGTYTGGGLRLRVFLHEGRPHAELAGQPALEIFAESVTMFFLTAVEATLEFSPEAGAARQVTLRQGDQEFVLERNR